METSAKTAGNVNGEISSLRRRNSSPPSAQWPVRRPRLLQLSPERAVASLSFCFLSELFYEIARKLPKTSPSAAPTGGIVLTDKVLHMAPPCIVPTRPAKSAKRLLASVAVDI